MMMIGRANYLEKHGVPAAICAPQIPRGLVWYWNWVFAMSGRRLTVWEKSRPKLILKN